MLLAGGAMKKGIHPDYRPVVLRDPGADFAFLARSMMRATRRSSGRDGNTYLVVDVDVSSARWLMQSHICGDRARVPMLNV
jgi:ribosomal protein L31